MRSLRRSEFLHSPSLRQIGGTRCDPFLILRESSWINCARRFSAIEERLMRTLVDLLNDDRGYVRIFAEPRGFGYEKSTHKPATTDDLFDSMGGYPSMEKALEAAQLQLQAEPRTNRRRRAR
jgi:hypothetical protein